MLQPADSRSARLAAAGLWALSAVLLLRIAGIDTLGGRGVELGRDPIERVVAVGVGLVAVILALLLIAVPSRRIQVISMAWGVVAGIGGCILLLSRHESALLVIVLAILATVASGLSWRSS